MTEDQLAVNQNAITLQVSNLDLDALLPDINWSVYVHVFALLESNLHTGIWTSNHELLQADNTWRDQQTLPFPTQTTSNSTLMLRTMAST